MDNVFKKIQKELRFAQAEIDFCEEAIEQTADPIKNTDYKCALNEWERFIYDVYVFMREKKPKPAQLNR